MGEAASEEAELEPMGEVHPVRSHLTCINYYMGSSVVQLDLSALYAILILLPPVQYNCYMYIHF